LLTFLQQPRGAPRRAGRWSIAARRRLDFYLEISPWLIGMVVFTGGPLLASLVISLTSWDILTPPQWVGIGNYKELLTVDPRFRVAVFNTAFYAVCSVSLMTVGSLLAAVLVNQRVPGVRWLRTIIYLPAVTSGVVLAVVWLWIYSPQFGVLQFFLSVVGLAGPPLILDPLGAKVALVLTNVWQIGPNMLIFLAGLQGVPVELYEAAAIDGAGAWAKFRLVTLPLLSPVTFFVITISVIGSFQVFTSALVITQGGPGTGTLFYTLYLYYRAFLDLRMGYAAAMAWILFVIILVLTLIQFRFARFWVYYETGSTEGPR
jgi:multiple sugar transport system permease protein